jgi:hypothetical protein
MPVDHWTLGGVADPLENRCLPCIGPSNNEDSELDFDGEPGAIVLCSHGTELCKVED